MSADTYEKKELLLSPGIKIGNIILRTCNVKIDNNNNKMIFTYSATTLLSPPRNLGIPKPFSTNNVTRS